MLLVGSVVIYNAGVVTDGLGIGSGAECVRNSYVSNLDLQS
jgi:hypothetical protein